MEKMKLKRQSQQKHRQKVWAALTQEAAEVVGKHTERCPVYECTERKEATVRSLPICQPEKGRTYWTPEGTRVLAQWALPVAAGTDALGRGSAVCAGATLLCAEVPTWEPRERLCTGRRGQEGCRCSAETGRNSGPTFPQADAIHSNGGGALASRRAGLIS